MRAFRTLLFFFTITIVGSIISTVECSGQIKIDSTIAARDSLQITDPAAINKQHAANLDSFLKKNKYLNITAAPVSLAAKEKNREGKEFFFYLLGIVILLVAVFKVFYTKYFNNIFRVFFNTSLRQNQLTDLLLQAKLPSLIFNIFFVVSTGLYAWLLLDHYHLLKEKNNYLFIGLSILAVGIIYLVKFLSLKFMGWISGMGTATDQYIFVIFLINKITGILLLPFIILLAFSPGSWLNAVIISSFCIIGILFLLRYLRSYGLLQNQIKINAFHFLLYIAGVEILPVLILYKVVTKMLL